MGIPAAGQHAYGFAGTGELLQELPEGALGVRGDVVVAHGEQARDRAREGAQQALRPSRAAATGTAGPARAARANGRPRAGSGARVGGAGGTRGASFLGAARARELGLEGAPLGGVASQVGGALPAGSTSEGRRSTVGGWGNHRRWADHPWWGRGKHPRRVCSEGGRSIERGKCGRQGERTAAEWEHLWGAQQVGGVGGRRGATGGLDHRSCGSVAASRAGSAVNGGGGVVRSAAGGSAGPAVVGGTEPSQAHARSRKIPSGGGVRSRGRPSFSSGLR